MNFKDYPSQVHNAVSTKQTHSVKPQTSPDTMNMSSSSSGQPDLPQRRSEPSQAQASSNPVTKYKTRSKASLPALQRVTYAWMYTKRIPSLSHPKVLTLCLQPNKFHVTYRCMQAFAWASDGKTQTYNFISVPTNQDFSYRSMCTPTNEPHASSTLTTNNIQTSMIQRGGVRKRTHLPFAGNSHYVQVV